jgi:SAM-dependent methyltransferase
VADRPHALMDASHWDERYRAAETVWGAAPNRWVEQEMAGRVPGRALDLACGEGRNAVWLANRGWRVTAVDFSAVGLAKGAELERHENGAATIAWIEADATTFVAPEPVDLALLCYLQLIAPERKAAVRAAAQALAPGGMLLVIGHDSRNLTDGTGGPQDPSVLFTAADIERDLEGVDVVVERSIEVLRPVDGADRPAIDALLRAVKAP